MNIFRKILSGMALGLTLLLCSGTGTAYADTKLFVDLNAEVGYFYYPKMPSQNEYKIMETDRQIKKLASDHPETAVLEKRKYKDYDGKTKYALSVKIKAPGVTRLSFQLVKGKKTITRSFYVQSVKYNNPFRSFKIGDIELAKRFKRFSAAGSGFPNMKGKIDIQCRKGWKFIRLEEQEDWDETYNNVIENGSEQTFDSTDTLYIYVLHEKSHRLLCAFLSIGTGAEVIE